MSSMCHLRCYIKYVFLFQMYLKDLIKMLWIMDATFVDWSISFSVFTLCKFTAYCTFLWLNQTNKKFCFNLAKFAYMCSYINYNPWWQKKKRFQIFYWFKTMVTNSIYITRIIMLNKLWSVANSGSEAQISWANCVLECGLVWSGY